MFPHSAIRRIRPPLAIAGCAVLIASCGGEGEPAERGAEPDRSGTGGQTVPGALTNAQFAGAESCKECHAQAYEDWTKSDHYLAMQTAGEESVLGDFEDATFTHYGHESRFFKRGGKFYVNTEDGEGARRDFEITHTFGFEPLQQYLIPFPGGRLQALQICWDTRPAEEGGQRWFHLYPDEEIPPGDILHWTGQHFNWNFMCADCHSTDLQKNFDFPTLSYDTKWAEMNVSCEACHGPASEHLKWAREPDESAREGYGGHLGLPVRYSESEPGAWVVDPETLQPKRTHPHDGSPAQVDTCARCHAHRQLLQPNFEAGHPLLDTHRPSVLDDRLYFQDGQINEEVYVYGSFVQSKMHHAGVRCTDCHQPHTMKPLAEGNALCVRCHIPDRYDTPAHHFHEPATAGASCVECHMPHKTYMVVDDRRDHSIRIPRPDLSEKLGTPNACNGCHAEQTAQWAADAITRWRGGGAPAGKNPHPGELFFAARNRVPGSDSELARLAADPGTNGIYRATALGILREIPTPSAAKAILDGREDPDPLVRTTALAGFESLPPQERRDKAIPMLRDPIRSVRIEAANTLAPFRRELGVEDAKAFDSAAKELIDAQLAIYDRAGGHFNLARFFYALGEPERAESSYRNGLKVDPADIPCAVNLSELLSELGRVGQGLPILEKAAELNPTSPDIWHALSVYFVRLKRYDKALETLTKAVKYAPESTRLLYFHGLALHRAGRLDEALVSLKKAYELDPTDAEIVLALATTSRDAGKIQDALDYTRKLFPLDPQNARTLFNQLSP